VWKTKCCYYSPGGQSFWVLIVVIVFWLNEIPEFIPSLICVHGLANYSPVSKLVVKFRIFRFTQNSYQMCWQEGFCCSQLCVVILESERESSLRSKFGNMVLNSVLLRTLSLPKGVGTGIIYTHAQYFIVTETHLMQESLSIDQLSGMPYYIVCAKHRCSPKILVFVHHTSDSHIP
jgi:hypothetical protein